MNDAIDEVLQRAEKESQERMRTIERLVAGADVSKVFGAPVVAGDRTVIAAAQVTGGGGFGSGIGLNPTGAYRDAPSEGPGSTSEPTRKSAGGEGAGGGGGGGGRSTGRPVAVIVIGPDAVEVKPILDITRITLTALAAFGILAALSLKRLARR
jgi:uncharacterized spore protein YtfJ